MSDFVKGLTESNLTCNYFANQWIVEVNFTENTQTSSQIWEYDIFPCLTL